MEVSIHSTVVSCLSADQVVPICCLLEKQLSRSTTVIPDKILFHHYVQRCIATRRNVFLCSRNGVQHYLYRIAGTVAGRTNERFPELLDMLNADSNLTDANLMKYRNNIFNFSSCINYFKYFVQGIHIILTKRVHL